MHPPPSSRARHVLRTVVLSALLGLVSASSFAGETRRPPQDYGGLPRRDPAAHPLLWVPRVVLFPLWLIGNYVLRVPIGALVRTAERDEWVSEIEDFFTFGARRQVTIYPSALFDFGLKPSVGFNAAWKYFGDDANTVKLHFGTWGPDWIAVRASDIYAIDRDQRFVVDTHFVRRKDVPYYGMGPRSRQDDEVRFGTSDLEAGAGFEINLWRESLFTASAGVRALSFRDGSCCGDPSLADSIQSSALPAPPGFDQGYTAAFQRIALAIDSRQPRPAPGSGIRVEGHAESTFALDERNGAGRRSWVRYGGAVGGMVDLTGQQRVLGLFVDAELADPLMGTIPFTDQVTLGGDVLMRGYLRGRLIDRSALVATLQYTWPVWVYFDGVIEAAMGNVFGERFAGLDPGLFRLSSGIGIRSNGDRDSGFELLVAFGTDPIEQGLTPSSFRLMVGSHHGF